MLFILLKAKWKHVSLRFGFFVMEKIPLDLLAFGVPRSLTAQY